MNLQICPLSHFQNNLHSQLPNRSICIWMDTPWEMPGGWGVPSCGLLEITSAATRALLSLPEVEDKNPCGRQLSGESQLPARRRSLGPILDELALCRTGVTVVTPQIPHRYRDQVGMSSRERKPYPCPLEARAEKAFVFQTAI